MDGATGELSYQYDKIPDHIQKAFELAIDAARMFVGATAPNPPVGCCILDASGDVLVTAAHQKAGTGHAEAMALAECRSKNCLHLAHTAIVTLEPCNHTGRTPPCTEALIDAGIREVWVGAQDPNPRVAGTGIRRLRDAGCSVHLVPESRQRQLCLDLIAPFSKYILEKKSWITVKQAVNAHGSMIPPAGRKTFTSDASLVLAHELRRATDAIVTGAGTILADKPGFDVRHVNDHTRHPRILVICDRSQRISTRMIQDYKDRNFDVHLCADIDLVEAVLGQAGALWAMVEGGPQLLTAIEAAGIWDDWVCIRHSGLNDDQIDLSCRHTNSPLGAFSSLKNQFIRKEL